MGKILLSLLFVVLILCLGYIVFLISSANKSNVVLDNIRSRKSVRHFVKNKKISEDKIEKILRAGMAAPSARNVQPWEFIVITDPTILEALSGKHTLGAMLGDASCAIVVAGNMDKASMTGEFWVQDTSAATENILLAVEALGLGAVWMGGYPNEERVKFISEELKLPANIVPLNIIAIGYPTGEDKPKDKWQPENIHYNGFMAEQQK